MRELILFNYTMDDEHPLLSHQPDIARTLGKHFSLVNVITNDGKSFIDGRLQVNSVNWKEGKFFRNLIRFYLLTIPILVKKKDSAVVFSHMTDLQSCLIAPLTRLLGIKHFLWYAHTHKSFYLKIACIFLDGIITSTEGSCPVTSDKVFPIGQAIDEKIFQLKALKPRIDLHRGVHVGRLDPSKNLDMIFTSVSSLRKTFPELSITQIGSPSTSFAKSESDLLRTKWDVAIKEGWISIEGSVTRAKLPLLFNNYDVFFHAYVGSLDKSLIEATMSGLPVVTINPEYLLEFGSWGNDSNPSIVKEYESLLGMDSVHYAEEIQRRYKIALGKHSKSRWIDSLVSLLTGVEETSGRSNN